MDSDNLVRFHDTWVTVDPIKGCPASCAYCYLGPLDLRRTKPFRLVTPKVAVGSLLSDERFLASDLPIAVGNYTDILMTKSNRSYLIDFVAELKKRGVTRPLCIITKAVIDAEFIAKFAAVDYPRVLFFLSQSFARESTREIERGAIASFQQTLMNAEMLKPIAEWSSIHFWRPFISAWNPTDMLSSRLAALKSSAISSSVVIGHKRFDRLFETDPRMHPYVNNPSDKISTAGDEDFFDEGFRLLTREADKAGYGLYRNTSCAISAALRQPDFLRTYSSPLRVERCRNVSCPASQREACGTVQPQTHVLRPAINPPRHELIYTVDLKARRKYSVKSNLSGENVPMIETNGKAWKGADSAFLSSEDERSIGNRSPVSALWRHPSALNHAFRLRRITGFATSWHPTDVRFQAFARYDHVQRVSWVADLLASRMSADAQEVEYLVWLHDLNRWAFAHNSEKSRYDQGEDTARFFKSVGVAQNMADRIAQLHRKEISNDDLSLAIATAADMITGLVEDPLMLLAGMNVSTEIFDGVTSGVIDFYSQDSLQDDLVSVCYALHVERNIPRFRRRFAAVFSRAVRHFLESIPADADPVQFIGYCTSEARAFKEEILRPKVFPINNDRVSRSTQVSSIVSELINRNGVDVVRDLLLQLDDETAVLAFAEMGIESVRIEQLEPRMDAVAENLHVLPLLPN